MAQDTGGAIRGPVRADYFWGFGNEAGEQAGKMKQKLKVWLLLPRQPRPEKQGTDVELAVNQNRNVSSRENFLGFTADEKLVQAFSAV